MPQVPCRLFELLSISVSQAHVALHLNICPELSGYRRSCFIAAHPDEQSTYPQTAGEKAIDEHVAGLLHGHVCSAKKSARHVGTKPPTNASIRTISGRICQQLVAPPGQAAVR
jgi:hypothetical protein